MDPALFDHRAAARGVLLTLLCAGTLCLAEPGALPFRFADRSARAGLAVELRHGGPAKEWILEANGSGAAVLDYDRDGWFDVLIVTGSAVTRLRDAGSGGDDRSSPGCARLYRNRGEGRFTDVTGPSGLHCPYWGTGANAADYDNDGDTDLLVTTIGRDLLFENDGAGRFEEVGARAGLSRRFAWHTGSAFGDYDLDGDLDLYVAGYVSLEALDLEGSPPQCTYLGLATFCGPLGLAAEPDLLYRNNGDGTFSDVTKQSGMELSPPRHGFSVVFEDFDSDGKPDVFVANDSDPNLLFFNRGDGTFREGALAAGVAYSASGRAQADMGTAVGDFDADGDLDLLTTTFSEDHFPLFEQRAPGVFEETSAERGLAGITLPLLGWSCGFADLDNDGDRDLWLANGHVYPTIGERGGSTYAQPLLLFENRDGRFLPAHEATAELPRGSHRGGVQADWDNDGRIDLLALPVDGAPVLLANQTDNGHSWIGLRLAGSRANRDALGARVQIEFCGRVRFETVRNGGSYLSRNDPRVHFGLGTCSRVDRVAVSWPGGGRQTLSNLRPNQWVEIREE